MTNRAHLTLLDPLRIAASVAIVWNHTRLDMIFGVGFGLFLFLVLTVSLAASSTREESLASFAQRRGEHLLRPWLRWSLVYVVLFGLADLFVLGQDPLARLGAGTVLGGGSNHLWFLPFAAAALVLVKALERPLESLRRRAPAPVFVALGLAVLGSVVAELAAGFLAQSPLPYPYRGWIGALPSIPFGLAVAESFRTRASDERWKQLALLAAVVVLVALGSPTAGVHERIVVRYAIAMAMVCVGFAWSPRVPAVVTYVARFTFGIYLVHPIFSLALKQIITARELPAWLHVGAVWGASLAAVYCLSRLPGVWEEAPRSHRLEPVAPSAERPRHRAAA